MSKVSLDALEALDNVVVGFKGKITPFYHREKNALSYHVLGEMTFLNPQKFSFETEFFKDDVATATVKLLGKSNLSNSTLEKAAREISAMCLEKISYLNPEGLPLPVTTEPVRLNHSVYDISSNWDFRMLLSEEKPAKGSKLVHGWMRSYLFGSGKEIRNFN